MNLRELSSAVRRTLRRISALLPQLRFLACTALLLLPTVDACAQSEAWVRRYNAERGSRDVATKVVVDADNNVIVVGSTDDNLNGANTLMIKYSSAGVPLWTNRPSGSVLRWVIDAAVDSSNNLLVLASSYNGFVTLAYSGAGVPLWTNRYDAPSAYARGLAVSSSGNVFVIGASYRSMSPQIFESVTIAYSGAGAPLWTNYYKGNGYNDGFPNALAVDAGGNVFVTGTSGYFWSPDGNTSDFVTLAYSGAGVALWTNRYNGPANAADRPTAVTLDSSGNVVVTGSSRGVGSDFDYVRIKYSSTGVPLSTDRYDGNVLTTDGTDNVFVIGYSSGATTITAYSDAGVPLWTNRYGRTNMSAGVSSLAVNSAGDVVLTGQSYTYDRGWDEDYQYFTIAYSSAGVPLWTNRCRAWNDDYFSSSIAIDSNDQVLVFVTGSSVNPRFSPDFVTTAYSRAGDSVWTNYYDGPGHGHAAPVALAVDFGGNVIVTGTSYGANRPECVTISYSDSGTAFWTNRFSGSADRPYDSPRGVKVDSSGNLFVTGVALAPGNQWGCTTFALSRSGLPLWTNTYDGGIAVDIAVDSNGNVFVAASGAVTIKYSNAGLPLWTNRYSGDGISAVVADLNGNVFVTGYRGTYSATIKYSNAGVPLWTNLYAAHSPSAMTVDSSGNVFVTGYSYAPNTGHDYATVAYSGAGVPLWTNRYEGFGTDEARAIAVDSSGNVFVTGSTYGEGERDYLTIAYSGTGIPLWTNRFEGPGDDYASAIAVDSNGNVIVTGGSGGSEYGHSFDFLTVAYSPTGNPLWTQTYNGPTQGNDVGARVAAGPNGVVYVTGYSSSGVSFDDESPASWEWVTIKYFPAPKLSIQPLSGPAQINLTLTGAPSSSWRVERASELSGPWSNLGSVTIGLDGSTLFQDVGPPDSRAFYRAREP